MKLDALAKRLEKAYNEEKAREAEELHNALAEVISEHKPSIQAALFVLDVLRFELMQRKYKEIMEPKNALEKDTPGR